MSEPTIEVHGMFGQPKQYTREQYIQEWTNHGGQFFNITVTCKDHRTIANFVNHKVKDMAGRRWDEIHERENT